MHVWAGLLLGMWSQRLRGGQPGTTRVENHESHLHGGGGPLPPGITGAGVPMCHSVSWASSGSDLELKPVTW